MPIARSLFHGRKRYYAAAAAVALPAYISAQGSLNTWTDTTIASRLSSVLPADPAGLSASSWLAWTGGTLAENKVVVFGGGHGDSSINAVLAVNLAAATPTAELLRGAGTGIPANNSGTIIGVPHYSGGGGPTARHSSYDLQYVPQRNRVFLLGGWAIYSNPATSINNVDALNLATNEWDLADTYAVQANLQSQNAPNAVCKDSDGNLYVWTCHDGTNWPLYKLTQSTLAWSTLYSNTPRVYDAPMAFDPIRNRLVLIDGDNSMYYDLTAGTVTTFSTTATRSASFFWCDDIAAFMHKAFNSSTIQRIDPVTFAASTYTVAGTPPTEGGDPGSYSVYGRIGYHHGYGIVYYVPRYNTNTMFFRTGTR